MKIYNVYYIQSNLNNNYFKNCFCVQDENDLEVICCEYSTCIEKTDCFNDNLIRVVIIDYQSIQDNINLDELKLRYGKTRRCGDMPVDKDNKLIEPVKEEAESYSDDSLYNITSFGTDLSFREIVLMYKDGDLLKPELQRKYVWTKNEASRFIDSILLGLPVPSIFLAKTADDKRLIVDGYQRIMTVYDFIEGTFSDDGKVFKLSNSENIHPNWRGKAYVELTEDQRRRIRTSPIHAIIFEQKQPQDDTGMYQIFERINTSGRVLKPQEIRNCVYHGQYNQLLCDLNKDVTWRKVVGSDKEDSRMADIELILRFFAFCEIFSREEIKQKQINLVKYLNIYMKSKNDISEKQLEHDKKMFLDIIGFLYANIGEHVFRTGKVKNGEFIWAKRINPVVFDAVCAATYKVGDRLHVEHLKEKYECLLEDEQFLKVTKQRTTNVENIKQRILIAAKILYGVQL